MTRKFNFALTGLMLIAAIITVSCSKDDDDTPELTLSQQSVTMVHDDTLTIAANQKCDWSTSDPFVAEVSPSGKITAKHVGEAVVSAVCNGVAKECKVIVKPALNTFKEPILDFNLTKSEIRAMENRTLDEDRDTALYYTDGKTYAIIYDFDKNTSKLKAATLGLPNISVAQSSLLADFLIERYQPIDAKEDYYYMINSDKLESTSMVVTMTVSVKSLKINAIVMYFKYPLE